MAQRRMFSPDITSSDAFLEMPTSSRELYFQLGMAADDDGFVSPRRVMRSVGASDDDLKILLAKRFLLSFEGGVVVIKHWLIHNLIRADLYKETLYKKEKATLGLNESGAYTEMREGVSELKVIEEPEWLKRRRGELRTANVPQTVHRLGQDRIGYISKTEVLPIEVVKDEPTKPKREKSKADIVFGIFKEVTGKYRLNWKTNKTQRQSAENLLEEHGEEQIRKALEAYLELKDEQHCPEIHTPWDLDTKWDKLRTFKKKHHGD